MDSGTFKQNEIILQEYPRYEDYIKRREEELLNPYTPQDTNQGGGKSNRTSDTTAVKAITLADDRILQRIKFQYRAVKNTYESADEVTQEIIDEYYFVCALRPHDGEILSKVSSDFTQYPCQLR